MNMTARLNRVDSQAWLAEYSNRAAHPAQRRDELLSWNWRDRNKQSTKAAQFTARRSSQMLRTFVDSVSKR